MPENSNISKRLKSIENKISVIAHEIDVVKDRWGVGLLIARYLDVFGNDLGVQPPSTGFGFDLGGTRNTAGECQRRYQ